MTAFASMQAKAQTVSAFAAGNCGGAPANCGTSDNRNGDRDTAWPGLQVDEGDTVTITIELSEPLSAGTLGMTFSRGGSAFTLSDLKSAGGFTFISLPAASVTGNFFSGRGESSSCPGFARPLQPTTETNHA